MIGLILDFFTISIALLTIYGIIKTIIKFTKKSKPKVRMVDCYVKSNISYTRKMVGITKDGDITEQDVKDKLTNNYRTVYSADIKGIYNIGDSEKPENKI